MKRASSHKTDIIAFSLQGIAILPLAKAHIAQVFIGMNLEH